MSEDELPQLDPACEVCGVSPLDVQGLEQQVRELRRQKTYWKNRALEKEERHPRRDEITEVFDYWRRTCKHPKARMDPGDDRWTKIHARLEGGFDTETLKRAIDGAGFDAYVDERGKRHDDIELICRSARKVEDFLAKADRLYALVNEHINEHALHSYWGADGCLDMGEDKWIALCPKCETFPMTLTCKDRKWSCSQGCALRDIALVLRDGRQEAA